jgi:hypothetical protein
MLIASYFKGRSMSIKKLITGLTLSLLLASGVASANYAADYNSAIKTFNAGGDETALIEMLVLAKSGHMHKGVLKINIISL